MNRSSLHSQRGRVPPLAIFIAVMAVVLLAIGIGANILFDRQAARPLDAKEKQAAATSSATRTASAPVVKGAPESAQALS